MITIKLNKGQLQLLRDLILGHIYDLEYNKQLTEERQDITDEDRVVALEHTISDIKEFNKIYGKLGVK